MTRRPPPAPSPSPEVAILLAVARRELREEDRRAIDAALAARPDWERLAGLADAHGLLPLLHRHLSAVPDAPRRVPAETAAVVAREARRWAGRNLELATELAALLAAMAERGIRVVSLKGPLLSQLLHGSLAYRQTVDLDLLVRPEDVDAASEVLHARGFAQQTWGSAEVDALERARSKHLTFDAHGGSCRVELHHALLDVDGRARFGLELFEDRLVHARVLGVPALSLAAEELLAYLCAHGSHHAWARLVWLSDVAELVRGGHVADWERVWEAARRLRATRRLRCGLLLAESLLGAPIPAGVAAEDRWARAAARSVAARIVEGNGRPPTEVEALVHELRVDVGVLARLRRVRRSWSPSAGDHVTLGLPRALAPLYVVARPIRLLLTYGPGRRLRRPEPPGTAR